MADVGDPGRVIEAVWRKQRLQQKLEEYGQAQGAALGVDFPDFAARLDRDIEDDLLSLIFTACHTVLSSESRMALTLKVLGGLTTLEIARAYLLPEATIAQRIVRAKRSLTEARVPLEVPRGRELAERLGSVLEVIYLIFNEGYSASSGEQWTRPGLCVEALRLGRILAGLMPGASEVHGLVALMELQASRLKARTAPDGRPILLLDQNRARWDQLLFRRGLTALARTEGTASGSHPLGPYALQAAIAACHAEAAAEFKRAAALGRNAMERTLLLERAAACFPSG